MWKKAVMGVAVAAAALTMSACGGASQGSGSSSGTAVPEGKVHCGILFRHRPYEAGG